MAPSAPEGRANPHQLCANPNSERDLSALRETLVGAHVAARGDAGDLLLGLQLTHSGRFSRPQDEPAPRTAQRHTVLDARLEIADDTALLSDAELDGLLEEYARVARCARDTAGMGSAGASVLAASLPSMVNLESVYLDQCGIGDEGARALAAVMPQCPSLLRLYIFSNPIGPAGKSALEAAIPECPKLTDTYKEAFFREEPCQVVT